MEERTLSQLKRQWSQLLKEGQELVFRPGHVLCYEGHSPYGLYVIRSGRVGFSKGSTPCPGDHLWHSPKGEVVGLDPFFELKPYCCTCTATKDCSVIFISKSQLTPFLQGG